MTRRPVRAVGRPRVVAALTVALLATLAVAGFAQASGFTVRGSSFEDDGSTTITISLDEQPEEPLTRDDVAITENGTPVEGLDVQPIGETETVAPTLAVGLVIDTSGSTEGAPLAAAQEAATEFLASISDVNANVVVVEFNDTATIVSPMTTDLATLSTPIEALTAEGETALYDAVVLAAEQVSQVDDAQRLLLVFSDGADTVSDATLQQAVDAATTAEAPITSIVLTSEELDTASLEALANGAGGSVITVDSTADLAGAFEAVAEELTNLYVISYSSSVTDPDELTVSLSLSLPTGEAEQVFTVGNPRRPQPGAAPPPSVDSEAGLLASDALLFVGIAAAFAAIVGILFFLILSPRSRASKVLERELNSYVKGEDRRRADSSAVAEALRRRAAAFLEASPSGAEFQSRVQKMLDQGQLPLKTVELLAIMAVAGLLLGVIGLVLAGLRGFLVFFPVGVAVPWLVMVVRRARRLSRFLEMLPDTLQLIAGSLSAGYGVLQSIDMVTRESEDPMSTEFNRVLVEARLGMPLEESLEAMAERMDSPDFRWVVLAMNIQREVGGNLAQLMKTVANTLREREALRRHIKALAAEGKLSAIVLVALPFFLAGYLVLVNPQYVGTLVESLIGWVMIAGGAIAMVIGIFWIRGLIRAIEV